MTNILNTFFNEKFKKHIEKAKTPSLNQGMKFLKYKNIGYKNISKNNLEKEGFINKNENSLTNETKKIINNNNYSSQKETIQNLRDDYEKALQEYQDLAHKISGNLTNYVDRVNPNNPYLNKVISFTTGQVCYVTNQGIVKYIPNVKIWKTLNIPQSVQISLDIPWEESYNTPGTIIPTKPQLLSGTSIKMWQSLGDEGTNVFVSKLLPDNTNISYEGCYSANMNNDNMSFIGGKPVSKENVKIKNGNFNEPKLSNNSYKFFTGNDVPNWYFNNATLLNNSYDWGYPMPYPNGEQCVSMQKDAYISTILQLEVGVNYTLSIMACARNCCMATNNGNPIKIELYTNLDAYISTITTLNAEVNSWKSYAFSFTVPISQSYTIYFKGTYTDGDQSTAIQNISLDQNENINNNGTFSFEDCKQQAINNGYKYFGLQNVNLSTNLGYCAVSNSEPAVTEYGNSVIPSKMIVLWSSNTKGQPGNTAILDGGGSLEVLNSNGIVIYSTPIPESLKSNADPYIGCYTYYGIKNLPQIGKDYKYTANECMDTSLDKGALYVGYGGKSREDKVKHCLKFDDLISAKLKGLSNKCNNPEGGSFSAAIYATSNNDTQGNCYLILQDDGNMCIYNGSGPTDNQGFIWQSQTNGKQQQANPNVIAAKCKFGKNWISSGSTLAAGDFIGSNDGSICLTMLSDGNLVLYTYEMQTNCSKMSNGIMGGGLNANAVYKIQKTAITKNMGMIGYIDANSNLYNYPNTNKKYMNSYSTIFNGYDSPNNDIPGAAFGNSTIELCEKACNNNDDCSGFVANSSGDYCWPKTNKIYPFSNSLKQDADKSIYVRDVTPASLPNGVSDKTNVIDSITYQNYINKGNIGSEYGLANATSLQKQQLQHLQSKMNMLSTKIMELTNKFQNSALNVEKQSHENKSGIKNYINDIISSNNNINIINNEANGNIHNILKDSDIIVLQKNYEYLFWSILAVGVVLVSMNVKK